MKIRGIAALEEPEAVTVETLRLSIAKLEAETAHLKKRIEPLLERMQSGEAAAEELIALPELSEDARLIGDRLRVARVELQIAEQKQQREQAEAKRNRFDDLVTETRRRRSEFVRAYREACMILGSLCANVDEATSIANSLVSVAGMMPEDRNKIAEMSERLDPLPSLLDSGLKPTTGFGWDWRHLMVIPLKGKTQNEKS